MDDNIKVPLPTYGVENSGNGFGLIDLSYKPSNCQDGSECMTKRQEDDFTRMRRLEKKAAKLLRKARKIRADNPDWCNGPCPGHP